MIVYIFNYSITMGIEDIAFSIKSKRNESLDSDNFSVSKIILSEYDIREGNRNVQEMSESLQLNGQKESITLNKRNNGQNVVVNGRTRFLALTIHLHWIECKVKFYDGLTELEEDYLNAILNSHQNPLTSDEKRNFVKKHLKEFTERFGENSIKELSNALKLTDSQVKDYIATVQPHVNEEIVECFKQDTKGYGRGEIKIEALAQVAKKVQNEDALKEIGK